MDSNTTTTFLEDVEDFFLNLEDEGLWWHWLLVILGGILVACCPCMCFCRRTTLGIACTVYLWISFWFGQTCTLLFQCIFWLLTRWWLSEKNLLHLMGYMQFIGTFFIFTINPFWRASVAIRESKIPAGSIIMSNHLSYVDSLVLAALLFPKSPKFVAMGKVFQLPIFGQVMRMSGHMPVWFTKEKGGWGIKKGTIKPMMDRAAKLLSWGHTLCVFPEGTLSKDGELVQFKDGFFKLAMETEAPIVPTATWGNHDLFPPGDQYALAHPGKVLLAIGSPVYPNDFSSVEELKSHVKEEVRRLRNSLPNFNKVFCDDVVELEKGALEEESKVSVKIDLNASTPSL